ncbi:MAG: hypothetical protein M0R51_15855 [Clostridia bacterium]|jgi:hypothetical protein|nr:hypothetical protein [Clostridia bacterium]
MIIQFNKIKLFQQPDGTYLGLHVKSPLQAEKAAEKCDGKLCDAELKIHRERRSLDSNAYAWELISKIAEALTAEAQGDIAYSKDDVYLIMLKKYGQGGIVKVPNDCTDKFEKAWKYHKVHEKLWDEKAVYYKFWVGSSNYNTKEMSLFINGIVSECKELGIETKTPDEIAKMEALWGT